MIIIVNIFKAIGRLLGVKSDRISATADLVEIEGNFNGDIINGRQVLISSTGCLKGNVTAATLEIYGNASGNIRVDNLLIRSSGRLYYHNLFYNDLQVEEGGVMEPAANGKKGTGKDKKKGPAQSTCRTDT